MTPDGAFAISVRGLDIGVEIRGEGEPLLLINGVGRPLASWELVTRELHGRSIITFDAPGVGASTTPIFPLTISAFAEVAAAVLDAAGHESADVVGFSHGGAVAQQLCIDSPQRVRSLVLAATSTTASVDPVGALWHALASTTWTGVDELAAIRVPTLVVCGSRDRIVPISNSEQLVRLIDSATLATIDAGHDLQRGTAAVAFAGLISEFLATKSAPQH